MSLTNRQQQAISALLTCPTKAEAAKRAGIADRTLRNYFDDDEFVDEYRRASRLAVDDAARQARLSLSTAITTLREIAENGEEPSTARVSASRALLEYGVRLVELSDVVYLLREVEGE